MITLTFEYGAIDKEPLVLTAPWYQITYSLIRNSTDEDIAFYEDGFWWVNRSQYSDIVIS